jgi:tryptophan halogenase
MNTIKKLLVVGGGTAGLISAIILKKALNLQIDVVHSKNIGIVGVGEGSTEHFRQFMGFAGIDQHTIIKECDATYKSGIMFTNWGAKDYLHNVGAPFNNRMGQYAHVFAKQIGSNDDYMTPKSLWNNRIEKSWVNKKDSPPFNQFHFNTHKLNDFLIKFAKSIGISVMEDDITDVIVNESGNISKIKGEKTEYEYDFYVDSTGFKRLLINKLGAKWTSYSKYLKMKAAITFATEDTDDYNLWTLAHAMDYGWLFRLPTWGRHGNGYIFDSDYIDAEKAKAEVERLFRKEVAIGKQFNFDPGALDRVWIKNCVAVGLSGSFIEPLEATSIGTSIQQSFLLAYKLINYDEKIIDSYNKSFTNVMENIRDFVVLHYMTNKTESDFWKDLVDSEIPDSLGQKLEIWHNKLPIPEDFNDTSDYALFRHDNFTVVMDGLNLFNRDAIKQEYENSYDDIKADADETIKKHLEFEKSVETFSHKEVISLIRNYL